MISQNDGVATAVRGDLVLSLWQKPARVHRTKWFFDVLDAAAAKNPGGIVVMLVILETASPPDAPARAENTARLRKLGTAIRRTVSVPLGDAVFATIVRTVMRAMFVVQRQSHVQIVESSVPVGIRRVLEVAGPTTPDRPQLELDLAALYDALGVSSGRAAPPSQDARGG